MSVTIVNSAWLSSSRFGNTTPTNDTCVTFNIPATTAGNLLVVGILTANQVSQFLPSGICGWGFLSNNADGQMTEVPFYSLPKQNLGCTSAYCMGSSGGSSGVFVQSSADIFYCITAGGATQLKFCLSDEFNAWYYEIHSSVGTLSLDDFQITGNNVAGQITGPSVNGTGSENFYLTIAAPAEHNNGYTSVGLPWTYDLANQVNTGLGSQDLPGTGNLFVSAAYILGGSGVQSGAVFNQAASKFTAVAASFKATPACAKPLFKLVEGQAFDDACPSAKAINSTYTTYGFVNAAKSTQNPLLGFHRKRFSETQMYIKGSGQATMKAFPNYILKQDGLTFNPYVYTAPPIVLQTDPIDDIVRPLNISGNRVFIMYSTNAVGASFSISKTILCGNIDGFSTVNPNA